MLKKSHLISFQLSGLGYILMPSLLSITRRLLFTMASETYKAGTHSMAFVTVPSEEVAKKLAGYAQPFTKDIEKAFL